MSLAPSLLCVPVERDQGATVLILHIGPPPHDLGDYLLGHLGHAVLQWNSKIMDSCCSLKDISVSVNIKLFLNKDDYTVGFAKLASQQLQPREPIENTFTSIILPYIL